jgi:hypothetical protein
MNEPPFSFGYHTRRLSVKLGASAAVAGFLPSNVGPLSFKPMLWDAHRGAFVPVALHAELAADEEVLPAFVTGMGEHGLHLDSLAILANRRSDHLQLQLTLPGEPERLWIEAEIVRDTHGLLFNETAIRFLAMANAHWRAVRRWVRVRALILATRPLGADHAA